MTVETMRAKRLARRGKRGSIPASGIYQCLAEVTVVNKKGLHTRASYHFVRVVEAYDAEVTVKKDGISANGGSILGLLTLNAGQGETLLIETEGPDAEEALDALTALVEAGFNEKE